MWGRILLLKLGSRAFDVVIIKTYAPNADAGEYKLEALYGDQNHALKMCRHSDKYLII